MPTNPPHTHVPVSLTSDVGDQTAARPFPFPPAGDTVDIEPCYRELRRDDPVPRVRMPYGGHAWLATRYEDIKTVLADTRFTRPAPGTDVPRMAPMATFGGSVVDMDGPDHARLRGVIAAQLSRSGVNAYRPYIQTVVDELLDQIVQHGPPADLVAGLSAPLPVMVLCHVLGVPTQDRRRLVEWSDAVLSFTDLPPQEILAAKHHLRDYATDLLTRADTQAGDGLLAVLARAHRDGQISHQEMIGFAMTLLVGGHVTTTAYLSNSLYLLLSRPHYWERLVTNPEVAGTAVEEMLRYIPLGIGTGNPRIPREPVTLSGVTIPAGDPVLVARHSGNRDEHVFPDAETIDLARNPNPHLGFGHGPHFCAGAQLARLEICLALSSLARRFRTLRLAQPASTLPWKTCTRERRVAALPATWLPTSEETP